MKLKTMLICAIFAALLCICSPISIPIGAIPISLLLFAVLLCALVLPWRLSTLSVLIFLLLGLWLPVFSGGHTGITALPGPTGGYIWSCLLITPPISLLCRRPPLKKRPIPGGIVSCLVCIPLCYLCGTAQYALLAGRSFTEALSVCVLPFLLPDLGKAIAASLLAEPLRRLVDQHL